jgi:hypothetical protein
VHSNIGILLLYSTNALAVVLLQELIHPADP